MKRIFSSGSSPQSLFWQRLKNKLHNPRGLTLGDLLYVFERIGLALSGFDFFHPYLDRFVHKCQLFFLDYSLVRKDGLADDFGLASSIAFSIMLLMAGYFWY